MLTVMTAEQFSLQTKSFFNKHSSKNEVQEIVKILTEFSHIFNVDGCADVNTAATVSRTIMYLCDEYEVKYPSSKKINVIRELRRQVLAAVQAMFVDCIKSQPAGQGLRGWARLRRVVAPVVSGARQGCLTLEPSCWIEAAVPEHFPSAKRYGGGGPFSVWSGSTSQENYVDWLRNIFIPGLNNGSDIFMLAQELSRNVHYGRDDERKCWEITVRNGKFYESSGALLDTSHYSSDKAGKGWAIFVRTPDGGFYVHEHRVHEFHHSSLNAGRPVMSAGEIMVKHGFLRGIANKSGHYKPTAVHFVQMLDWLRAKGVYLAGVRACHSPMTKPYEFVDAAEFLNCGGARECNALPAP